MNKKHSSQNYIGKILMAICCLFVISCFIPCSTCHAQTGTWRTYMAYSDIQQIVKGNQRLYVRASNNLYSYNLNDQSITTYDKINQLSDNHIDRIVWNPTVNKLLILYQNKNIDLLNQNDEVFNINSYYVKTMTQDKTVNNACVYLHHIFLCTAFGLVKINLNKNEVSESYILNRNIMAAGVSGDSIYVHDSNGTDLAAKVTSNLIDPHNWKTTVNAPAGIFNDNTADWDQYYAVVKTLQPGGPVYNYFNYMKFENNQLITTGGGWIDGGEFSRPGCVQILDSNKEWNNIINVQPLTGTAFKDATSIAFDPSDSNHFFVSTCGTGLYEFRNGTMVNNYTNTNSPLQSALASTHPAAPNYVRVDGLVFDLEGNLWMSCSSENTRTNIILRLNPTTGEWTTYSDAKLIYNKKILTILRRSILDRNGNIWMVNDHHSHPCMIKITPSTETIERFDNFTNQDGISTDLHYVRCVMEDMDGNLWMGSDQGLYMYDENQQNDPTAGYTQIKVPRNDGTDLADYLLANADVTAIAFDGAKRKWIGTANSGVYLISADNTEQLHHFTTEDSPLLSDNIESLAINPTTGEVFFGTDKGLCSYMSDATTAIDEMKKDDVYAFPNPVPSDYQGLITVRGLSMDADVKILTISGRVVAQGRSNGGTFTWNGRDQSNKRVASGVYMIATATSDGKRGVVAKIAVVH